MIPADWYEEAAVQLAGESSDLRALLASRDTDIRWRDEIIRAALHALHDLTVKRRRDAERYAMLCDELRRLRGTETRRAA